MKLKKKYVAALGVAIVGAAVAILPVAISNAAVACLTPWSASTVYVANDTASQDGFNYRAKWWTQNQSPKDNIGDGLPWEKKEACGDGGTDPTTPPTTTPPDDPTTPPPSGNGAKMDAAPYLYPGWGTPPAPGTVMSATGIKAFTVAFVLSSPNGCEPLWDGQTALTSPAGVWNPYRDTITAITAAGGSVVPSIGGWQGTKLGPKCGTPEDLAGAYQKVIDAYQLKSIDIDIENTDEFEDQVVRDRIVAALKIVKEKNPGVTTILTFGTTPTGPTATGKALISKAKEIGAGVDIFTQMPFDYPTPATDMVASTISASEGLKDTLKSTFGYTDEQAYSHMGISGMNGLSDQKETTTVADWEKIRDYAKSKGLARFTFWSVNRDRGCEGGGVTSACSGIAQEDWAFTKVTSGF